MAQKASTGTAKNLTDSESKRLGVKLFGGQHAKAGAIIVRQRGQKYRAGKNVGMGKDHTLFAKAEGTVQFRDKRVRQDEDNHRIAKVVDVIESEFS